MIIIIKVNGRKNIKIYLLFYYSFFIIIITKVKEKGTKEILYENLFIFNNNNKSK
jgi:hypothetical protein